MLRSARPDDAGRGGQPQASAHTQSASLPGSREEPRTSPAKVVSVLVVEDSSIVRDRLVSMISEMPQVAIVGQAEEGFKAERMFDQLRPDAVILDIQLPGIHGMELLARFKKAHPACVVMVLTTYAFQEFRQRCMASGADHFFDKATEFERITQVLEAMQSRSSIHPPL